jgi:hypothetical protein
VTGGSVMERDLRVLNFGKLFGKTCKYMNSVLEGLSMKRFADIHKSIWRDFSNCTFEKRNIFTELVRREKEIKSLYIVSSAYRWWWTEDLEMMVLIEE